MTDISKPANFTFTLPEGEYDVILSVSNNVMNRVHWSRKAMKLSVKIGTEEKLTKLKNFLLSKIDDLKQTVNNLTVSIAKNMTQLIHGERKYDKHPPSPMTTTDFTSGPW